MKRVLIGVTVLLILLLAGVYYHRISQVPAGGEYIEFTGIVEAKEVEVGSTISGRIEWLCCKEGDRVKKGDTVVRLGNKELEERIKEGRVLVREAESLIRRRRTEIERARAQIKTIETEIESTEAEIRRIGVLLENARKELDRAEALYREGFITERELDEKRTTYRAYTAQIESIRARKGTILARLEGSKIDVKTREALLNSAIVNKQKAEAHLRVLMAQLDDTVIRSPVDGTVVYQSHEEGEIVSPGQSIYTIHDLTDLWVTVDVEETLIGRIRIGMDADVVLPSMEDRVFRGRVKEIGRFGEFATQRDVKRGRSDIRTFRVKIGVERPEGFLKPGMTAIVRMGFKGDG